MLGHFKRNERDGKGVHKMEWLPMADFNNSALAQVALDAWDAESSSCVRSAGGGAGANARCMSAAARRCERAPCEWARLRSGTVYCLYCGLWVWLGPRSHHHTSHVAYNVAWF